MSRFKFKTKKRGKFNFIKNNDELTNYDIISESHTELFSNKKAIIEGCRKILDYQNQYVKLKLKKGTVTFMGNGFIITDFNEEKIVVKGNICSIEFCV